jgi:hypothetical protein
MAIPSKSILILNYSTIFWVKGTTLGLSLAE